jgi:hypothetical protein
MNKETKIILFMNIFKNDEKCKRIKLNTLDYLINIKEFLSKKIYQIFTFLTKKIQLKSQKSRNRKNFI